MAITQCDFGEPLVLDPDYYYETDNPTSKPIAPPAWHVPAAASEMSAWGGHQQGLQARRDVSVSLNKVAAAARARGDLAAAERLFAESPEISPALAKEVDTPEARRDLALCHLYLAGIAETRGDVSAARTALAEARVAAEAFGQQQPISDAEAIMAVVSEAMVRLRQE